MVEKKEKNIIEIGDNIVVKDLAEKMGLKVTELIAELMKNKIFASINETVDFDTAVIVGDDLGFEIMRVRTELERGRQMIKRKELGRKAKKRPPVVVVMGHVDHGKTTLLDKILSTNVASGESGGITQNVSAYQVKKKGEVMTFMDTPGHQAFHSMRERGAFITDMAVIVVAADDGVKPQTKEAVEFAKNAGLPILVAINKIDKPEANIEKAKKELSEIDLLPEEWGGQTVCVNISAKTGEGIDNLLDMIILYSDMEELRAEYDVMAEGFIMESYLDPQIGPVAVALIQNGTLKAGDFITAGPVRGRVKTMNDFKGSSIKAATPSMPVTILGFNNVPKAGSIIKAFKIRKEAEAVTEGFLHEKEENFANGGKVISSSKTVEGEDVEKIKKLNLIIKADTKGSLEAIIQILETMKGEGVATHILKTGVGNITETDIKLARSSDAKIIGFNSSVDSNTRKFADKEKVVFNNFSIIYELASYVKEELSKLLEAEIVRVDLGKLKVIAIFKLPRKSAKVVDMIFGAKISGGKAEKGGRLEVMRNGEKVGEGTISELQHNKKTVSELKSGNNAGITFRGNVTVQEGDEILIYKEEKRQRTISI